MTQNAIVKQIVDNQVAQVSLLRQLECGLSCEGSSCEGCGMKPKDELLAMASNPIGAKPGDLVQVESNAGNTMGIAFLVFLLPCIMMGAGYILGQTLFHLGDFAALGTAVIGLVLGAIPAVLLNRSVVRRGTPEFTIQKRLA